MKLVLPKNLVPSYKTMQYKDCLRFHILCIDSRLHMLSCKLKTGYLFEEHHKLKKITALTDSRHFYHSFWIHTLLHTFILCMHMKSTFSYVSHHHNNLLAQACCSSNHDDFHKYFVWPISSLQEYKYFFDILKIRNMFLNDWVKRKICLADDNTGSTDCVMHVVVCLAEWR